MPILDTMGYAYPGALERLHTLMQNEDTILCDWRRFPTSKYHPWDGDDLRRDWGNRYIQAGDYLGNPNAFNGGHLALVDERRGINGLLHYLVVKKKNVIGLCGCKVYCKCHRSVAVARLQIRIAQLITHARTILEENPHDVIAQERLNGLLEIVIREEPVIETLKCLSVKPPFAEWIALRDRFVQAGLPPKTIENRDYETPFRTTGNKTRVLIHSSHSSQAYIRESIEEWTGKIPGMDKIVAMNPAGYEATSGKIIAIADLVDVVSISDDPWFVTGQSGWIFEHVQLLHEFIPYHGKPYLFDVPLSVVEGVLPRKEKTLREYFEEDQLLADCVKTGIPVEMGQRYLDRMRYE